MDLHPEVPEEVNSSEENIFEFSKDSSMGFSSELMVSQDQLRKISKSKLMLKKDQVFRMPSSLALAMKKAFSRKNEIIYCISSKEISVDISEATGKVYLPLLQRDEVKQQLARLDPKVRKTISMVHIGAVKILLKAQFRNGIDTPVSLALIDDRVNDRKDCILGIARGNLAYGKFMFTVHPKFAVSLQTERLNQVLSLIHNFENKNLMNTGDKIMSLTYLVGYALTNSHHSIDYKDTPTIEIEDVFQEIGTVQESEFCKISEEPDNWLMDIRQNKPQLGQSSRKRVTDNRLRVESGESSNRELQRLNSNVDSLREKIMELCG